MRLAKFLSRIYNFETYRSNGDPELYARIDRLIRRAAKFPPGTATYKAVWFAPHEL